MSCNSFLSWKGNLLTGCIASASHVMSALMCIDWLRVPRVYSSPWCHSISQPIYCTCCCRGWHMVRSPPWSLSHSLFHSLFLSFFLSFSFFLCLSEAIGNCKTTDCQPLKMWFSPTYSIVFFGVRNKGFWVPVLAAKLAANALSGARASHTQHVRKDFVLSRSPFKAMKREASGRLTNSSAKQSHIHRLPADRDWGEQQHPAYHSTVWHSIKYCHGFMCNIMCRTLLCNSALHYIVTFHTVVISSKKQCMHIGVAWGMHLLWVFVMIQLLWDATVVVAVSSFWCPIHFM